jgi:mRNA interferase RelE/StbE
MAGYKVFFRPSADRQLRKLPAGVQCRIVAEVATLAANPRPAGVVKLAGEENLWRIRIGNYRVVYEIHDDRLIVLVLRVANRKDVYRRK